MKRIKTLHLSFTTKTKTEGIIVFAARSPKSTERLSQLYEYLERRCQKGASLSGLISLSDSATERHLLEEIKNKFKKVVDPVVIKIVDWRIADAPSPNMLTIWFEVLRRG